MTTLRGADSSHTGWADFGSPDSGVVHVLRTSVFASPEDIIEEARNGRMFILVDDEDRENEGDLVLPAQMATPQAINFMATHGRGLICVALSKERADALGLAPMSRSNGTRHETAFTVSIEARDGVTTGISAADRARTITTAIDGFKGAADIVSPGHVFPLIARDGGVLMRPGHTEAAVDVARLAGLNASGVICEIMKEDGTMARVDDLASFSKAHQLKMGTIRDLIAYRCKHDPVLACESSASFESRWGGAWRSVAFRQRITGRQTTALIKGEIDSARPVMLRVHAPSLLEDMCGARGTHANLLSSAMEQVARAGAGLIVFDDVGQPEGERHAFGCQSSHDTALAIARGLGARKIIWLGDAADVSGSQFHAFDLQLVGAVPNENDTAAAYPRSLCADNRSAA